MVFNILSKMYFYLNINRKIKRSESFFNPFTIKVTGLKSIEIGKNVYIGSGGWLASTRKDNTSGIIIEDNVSVGRYSHIFATRSIHIEKSVLIAESVYISDNLHNYRDISIPIMNQATIQCDDVVIGEGSWIGEHVCIIGSKIGRHCVIGANSVVLHDIPDYCVAVGAPARIIKRYDFKFNDWIHVDF